MKITREVSEFAARRKQGGDAFLAADLSAEASAKAEAGMAGMSGKFREKGGEISLPAAE